jgi:hypothetical protein
MNYFQALLFRFGDGDRQETEETTGRRVPDSLGSLGFAEPAQSQFWDAARCGCEPEPANPPTCPPRPAELGAWPADLREARGHTSTCYEDSGVPFPESERRAFAEVKAELQAIESAYEPVGRAKPSQGLTDARVAVPLRRSPSKALNQSPVTRGPRDVRRGDKWLLGHTLSPRREPEL